MLAAGIDAILSCGTRATRRGHRVPRALGYDFRTGVSSATRSVQRGSLDPRLPGGVLRGHQADDEPMVLPVKRCQSPICTASANPVRLLTPLRHPRRRTPRVNSLLAAIVEIASSSRSRLAFMVRTAS